MKSNHSDTFFGWVDFSDADTKHANEFLASLNENTLDELGLGRIRDAISDRLFPATSTTMKYARYLLIVPAIFQDSLDNQTRGKSGEGLEEKYENTMRLFLKKRVKADEFKSARKDEVVSKPSAQNWSALRKLGILKQDVSRTQYRKRKRGPVMESNGDDHDHQHLRDYEDKGLWDKGLFDAISDSDFYRYKWWKPSTGVGKGELPPGMTIGQRVFKLTESEAKYLKEKYKKLNTSTPESGSKDAGNLLQHLLEGQNFDRAGKFPWDMNPPKFLQELVDNSRRFSQLAGVLTLAYWHYLLVAKTNETVTEASLALEAAWPEVRQSLKDWDCKIGFKETLYKFTAMGPRQGMDFEFLGSAMSHLREQEDIRITLDSTAFRELLKARESTMRRDKARLTGNNQRLLKSWSIPSDALEKLGTDLFLFDFRGTIAHSLVCQMLRKDRSHE